MKQYQDLIRHVLNNGIDVKNRTGIDTKSIFGYQMRFNLNDGFPAVTTKKLAWKSVVSELLWFLEGSTDERRLAEILYDDDRTNLVGRKTIWTANADAQGKSLGYLNTDTHKELGPVYGAQWRNFDYYIGSVSGVDQIAALVSNIRKTPDSRRLVLSAWNPLLIDDMALPPCHIMSQFRVIDGKLNCQMYQRSADIGLGVPFNIASYALLTHIIARECNLNVGDFIHTIGDAHIYNNHIEAMEEIASRKPYDLPSLKIDDKFDVNIGLSDKFPFGTVSYFTLDGYKYHPEVKMDMAV